MNRPAHLFRTLAHAFNRDAADPAVDALAAELAACAARSGAPLLLGLLRPEAVPRYFNLVFVLDGYGLTLRQRYRRDGDAAWLYLEPKGRPVSEFAGTAVRARRLGASELPPVDAAARRRAAALPEAA